MLACCTLLGLALVHKNNNTHNAQTLKGHGKDIHDIAVHPTRPQLVLTGSKDESIRLWNIET